ALREEGLNYRASRQSSGLFAGASADRAGISRRRRHRRHARPECHEPEIEDEDPPQKEAMTPPAAEVFANEAPDAVAIDVRVHRTIQSHECLQPMTELMPQPMAQRHGESALRL